MIELDFECVRGLLGERPVDSNKGRNGKGLLLAGSDGLTGAALMSATAALRTGIGTLKVLCPQSVKPALYALPEAIPCTFAGGWGDLNQAELHALLQTSTCVGVGPGMDRDAGVQSAVKEALSSGLPMVLDADGLNALAAARDKRSVLHGNTVLTPHPGEMARLCAKTVAQIVAGPRQVAEACAREWGCVVLLKGHESFIAEPSGRVARNTSGNAGLSKGGSGDVLTGMILALLGQGLGAFDAACAGAFLLGASADQAFELLKERMLMARDVIDAVEQTLKVLLP